VPTRCVAESRTIGALDLTTADRGALLRLARGALEAYLAGGDPPALPEGDAVRQKCGAFVTLAAAGALRGCVGHVPADRPLARVVRDMVVAAGRDDARFPPVAASELGTLRIEISVLTEPAPLVPAAPERVVIGRDGLLVRRGAASGLLLPQVAPEQHWGPEAFLAAACRKAGLAADAWREPETHVLTFQADVFAEAREAGGGMREA